MNLSENKDIFSEKMTESVYKNFLFEIRSILENFVKKLSEEKLKQWLWEQLKQFFEECENIENSEIFNEKIFENLGEFIRLLRCKVDEYEDNIKKLELKNLELVEKIEQFINILVSSHNEILRAIEKAEINSWLNNKIQFLRNVEIWKISKIKSKEKVLYDSIINFLISLFKRYYDEKYLSWNHENQEKVIKFGDYKIDSDIKLKSLIEKLNKMKDKEPREIKLTKLEMLLLRWTDLVKKRIAKVFSKSLDGVKNYDEVEKQLKNFEISESCNPAMYKLVGNLIEKFWSNIEVVHVWPASKSNDKKTDVVCKVWEFYIKWFTKSWAGLWKREEDSIGSFNQFSEESNSKFSWPNVIGKWKTEDGWFYFMMKDAKEWEKKELLDFSKLTFEQLMELYNQNRQTFDEFEEYSGWKTSIQSKIQFIYSLYKRFLQQEALLETTTRSSKIINWVKKSLNNVLQPAFKLAIAKKYQNKINERISNGQGNVRACGIDADIGKINKTLIRLLSKVKNIDFEYNFWRLWTWHVFADKEREKFTLLDFDNVSYQIEWTELIWIMWSNLLISVWKYDTYEAWKADYREWYQKLLETYEDKNLIKLLLFVKLVWTIFEDYWHLIFVGRNKGENSKNFEEIKKWVQRNYEALQELMEE